MKWPHLPDDERLLQLLADEATEGLPEDRSHELDLLLDDYPGIPADCLALTAASVDCAFAGNPEDELPDGLRRKLMEDGRRWASSGGRPVDSLSAAQGEGSAANGNSGPSSAESHSFPTNPAKNTHWLGSLGWLAAAACLAFLVLQGLQTDPPAEAKPNWTEERANLRAEAPDVVTLAWAGLKEPGYADVEGNVVWSTKKQEGYMLLEGFPPTTAQEHYQLWIVDPKKDIHPVDGGVFELESGGPAVVKIDPALRGLNPKAFVLTREQPGGVVVSDGPHLAAAGL